MGARFDAVDSPATYAERAEQHHLKGIANDSSFSPSIYTLTLADGFRYIITFSFLF